MDADDVGAPLLATRLRAPGRAAPGGIAASGPVAPRHPRAKGAPRARKAVKPPREALLAASKGPRRAHSALVGAVAPVGARRRRTAYGAPACAPRRAIRPVRVARPARSRAADPCALPRRRAHGRIAPGRPPVAAARVACALVTSLRAEVPRVRATQRQLA